MGGLDGLGRGFLGDALMGFWMVRGVDGRESEGVWGYLLRLLRLSELQALKKVVDINPAISLCFGSCARNHRYW